MDYTISETYTLPSRGKIYNVKIDPEVQLRSMTTNEEMMRLSHTDTPYRTLCNVIDACWVNKPDGVSSYNLHLGDYQFLLHRLRVVTYGTDYPITSVCPVCGKVNKSRINLDEIKVLPFDSDEDLKEFNENLEFTLPRSGKKIKIKFQTPADLDTIQKEVKDFNEKNPEETSNQEYLITLLHIVDKVDGKKITEPILKNFLKNLPLMDTNIIIQKASKINEKVGIDTIIKNECSNSKCGAKYRTSFRITNEFFGPSID